MKPGKISENVLKRSVFKYIEQGKKEVARGAGIGNDCALFSFEEPVEVGVSTATSSLAINGKEQIRRAIHSAVNSLAAGGQNAKYITLNITLPERAREIKLQEMMAEAAVLCNALHLQILGGHTEVSAHVDTMIVSATVFGSGAENSTSVSEKDVTGYDVVVSKYIGMEAAGLIARKKEEELLLRYPKWLVAEAANYEDGLSVIKDVQIARNHGIEHMHDISEGGIFGALWEMAQRLGKGLSIDIKKIPMKQSVVEICNFYDLNPYELLSQGCLLMVAENGEALVEDFAKENIMAAIIGKLTDSNDRIIENGEEIRYMDLPKTDQIRKLL